MKRTAFLIVLFVSTAAALFSQTAPRLAVAEFTTNNQSEWLKKVAIAARDMVESHMAGMKQYTMVSQNEIDSLLKDRQIQIRNISSDRNIEKLNEANINYIITGSVDEVSGDYAINVRFLDVFNAEYPISEMASVRGASREFTNGINDMMNKFTSGIVIVDDRLVQSGAVTIAPISIPISIEVTTKERGILYFQGEKVAILWDNDTFTIPIDKPGTYRLTILSGNNIGTSRSVTIKSGGVTKVDFSYCIGGIGPAGGIVFYDKGNYNYGWRYLEAAPANTEFTAQWGAFDMFISGTQSGMGTGKRNTELIVKFLSKNNEAGSAAQRCTQLNINGFTDWFLPSIDELNAMYRVLSLNGLGGFNNSWYWSSSHNSNDLAMGLHFIYSYAYNYYKNRTGLVRAIRAF